jgi:Zn-dependent membrane protease YugP
MVYIIIIFLLFALIFAPNLWVNYVLNKHHKQLPNMPGTGGELAIHLLKQYELEKVTVEKSTKDNDYYSPSENAVYLSPEAYDGKSLSAVAIAAHEVGHAIQFNRKEAVSLLRDKYLGSANFVHNCGIYILMTMPILSFILKVPHLAIFSVIVGTITMFASILLYAAVLPEEWDASFNKALPMLEKGGYVPVEYMPAIRQILTACALTYVATALANILRLWQWIASD